MAAVLSALKDALMGADATNTTASSASLERASTFLGRHLPEIHTSRIETVAGFASPHHSYPTYFPQETLLAAISVAFCRLTISSHQKEPALLRWMFAMALAILAYRREPYWIICAFEIFSYSLPLLMKWYSVQCAQALEQASNNGSAIKGIKNGKQSSQPKNPPAVHHGILCWVIFLPLSGILAVAICRMISLNGWMSILQTGERILPSLIIRGIKYLFPLEEMGAAYDIVLRFMPKEIFHAQMKHLLFITFHIQVGMGFLGIGFLTKEQMRRNELVRLEDHKPDNDEDSGSKQNGKKNNNKNQPKTQKRKQTTAEKAKNVARARKFRWNAVPFIFLSATPYMMQLIIFGGLNEYSYSCFRDDMHRAVRLNKLFEHDAHLVAMSMEATLNPGVTATCMDTVISTVYDLFNRKLFSLPKLILIPSLMAREPMLILNTFPFILLADKFKGWVVAMFTNEIQRIHMKSKDLKTIRNRIEAFDLKNADLLQRSGFGSTQFTQYRWVKQTEEIQGLEVSHKLLTRTKMYFQWLQRNFVMMALVDGALGMLIAASRITSADVFVFARAIEDAIDLLLMRSRAESELATMMTDIEKLTSLSDTWEESRKRNLIHCTIAGNMTRTAEGVAVPSSSMIKIENLSYVRGTASVRVPYIELPAGIYALTGANGSGKSSLFRVIMGCDSNRKGIDLPPSIEITQDSSEQSRSLKSQEVLADGSQVAQKSDSASATRVQMPSSDVVEISQNFYWPLHTKPVDWIYQDLVSEMTDAEAQLRLVSRVEQELHELEFKRDHGKHDSNLTETLPSLKEELLEEKDDWFNELSGGQKCKVELVRKVFLSDECPKVLLIDETLAPLDPASKVLVMQKIKSFCRSSIVIVIYHNDVADNELEPLVPEDHFKEDVAQTCVPSNNFFDDNLHVENGYLEKKSLCI